MFNKFKYKRIIRLHSNNISDGLEKLDNTIINKRQNSLFRAFKFGVYILIIIGFFLYNGYSNFKSEILIKDEVIIKIQSGDLNKSLAAKLNINNSYLKIYLKNNNPDFKLIAGNFKIPQSSDIQDILIGLKTPIIENVINVTILEGWNIFDIDEYLEQKGLINKGEYIKYVQNKNKIKKLSDFFPFIKGLNTLEGFLYPDTYNVISNNFKINGFVIKQLESFENKVFKSLLQNLDNKKIEELINLSSIVEKEEKNKKAKPIIAGILKKRLNEGWMIGADITVCYPHKLTANKCKLVISKYINEKSQYNTRTMKGLPKTPIGNPNFETINATLNSKKTQYYFYLHDTVTGKAYYARTNAEHERNKRLYLR